MKHRMVVFAKRLTLVLFLVTIGVVHLPRNRSLGNSLKSNSVQSNNLNSNRTLVILLGNLRGGEKAWNTLHKHLLEPNNADLGLLVGETRDVYKTSSLFDRAKYIWKISEYDDWADAIDLVNGSSWRQSLLPLIYEKSWVFGGIKGHEFVGSGAIGLMMRWFLSQRLSVLEREGQLAQYNRFVVTRADHFYLCDHNLDVLSNDMDSGFLMVPSGEDYGGITDRHLVVGRKHIFQALNVLPPILQNPQRYSHLFDSTHGNNLERLIAYRWAEDGLPVQRFDRMMFICGEDGDGTRTTKLGMSTPDGVKLKYPKEYVASYLTCGKIPGVIN